MMNFLIQFIFYLRLEAGVHHPHPADLQGSGEGAEVDGAGKYFLSGESSFCCFLGL